MRDVLFKKKTHLNVLRHDQVDNKHINSLKISNDTKPLTIHSLLDMDIALTGRKHKRYH